MSNKSTLTIKQARRLPGWSTAVNAAVIVTLMICILNMGMVWMTYLLGVISLALLFAVHLIFNDYASYFNHIQFKELVDNPNTKEVIEQIIGTFRDETCLTKEQDDEESPN
jgi:hypothetical protein